MTARSLDEKARELFAPLGPTYDRVGAALSLGQDPLWRRFLVSRLRRSLQAEHQATRRSLQAEHQATRRSLQAEHQATRRSLQAEHQATARGGRVLDVATGTGLVASRLLRQGFTVTGVDQSPEMLAVARRHFGDKVDLINASAQALPLESESFDHVTFTYLLRYVADPGATLAEIARVVRPGGFVASLEFGVPEGFARPAWDLYVRAALPLAGRLLRNGWNEVGDFLGPSIRDFWKRNPLERQLEWWHAAGLDGVEVRRLTFGAAVVIWGRKT